jgi:hypothetical protein
MGHPAYLRVAMTSNRSATAVRRKPNPVRGDAERTVSVAAHDRNEAIAGLGAQLERPLNPTVVEPPAQDLPVPRRASGHARGTKKIRGAKVRGRRPARNASERAQCGDAVVRAHVSNRDHAAVVEIPCSSEAVRDTTSVRAAAGEERNRCKRDEATRLRNPRRSNTRTARRLRDARKRRSSSPEDRCAGVRSARSARRAR